MVLREPCQFECIPCCVRFPMSQSPLDGLMHLAQREGVDIRPTLLRVLTDLYVQSPTHSLAEQQQYTELASRLIADVDNATRDIVRARLAAHPDAPPAVLERLEIRPASPQTAASFDAKAPATGAATVPAAQAASGTPGAEAAAAASPSLEQRFMNADSAERIEILRALEDSQLPPASRPDPLQAGRAIALLERTAFAADLPAFATELADALSLPQELADRIVSDASGELLACAAKALGMPEDVFQRVLIFLKPEWGHSVLVVFRLARLFETLNERASLVMLAAWRGLRTERPRTKYQPTLYDDQRRRARPAAGASVQPGSATRTVTPAVERGNQRK